MNEKEIIYKIKYLLNKNVIFLNELKSFAHVFIVGGMVRNVILNETINDIDIVVYEKTNEEIKVFLNNNKINYAKNRFGGFRIKGKLSIDLWGIEDLLDAVEYNLDAIFYDINNETILSFGFKKGIKTKRLELLNENNKTTRNEKRRKKLLNVLERIDLNERRN